MKLHPMLTFMRSTGWWVIILAMTSGLPILLIGSTLQAWYVEKGIDLLGVGSLTLVGMPYLFKWLWAPALQRYQLIRSWDMRGWIVFFAVLLALGFWVLSRQNPEQHPVWTASIALMIAVFSATFDTANDGYRTECLAPKDYAWGTIVHSSSYRLAMITGGGGALLLADAFGWAMMYTCMAALFLVSAGLVMWMPPLDTKLTQGEPASLWEPITLLWQRPRCLEWIIFLILCSFSYACFNALSMPFALNVLNFSLSFVGLVFKFIGIPMIVVGALLGGLLLNRVAFFQAIVFAIILNALCLFSWLFLLWLPSPHLFIGISCIEHMSWGILSTLVVTLMMRLCQPGQATVHFAIWTSIYAITRVLLGPMLASLIQEIGWGQFFISSTIILIPTLAMAWRLQVPLNALSLFNATNSLDEESLCSRALS